MGGAQSSGIIYLTNHPCNLLVPFGWNTTDLLLGLGASQELDQAAGGTDLKCPKCGYDLITGEWHGIQIDQCTHCHGIWFDAGEAESVLAHPEPNIVARVFRALLRGVSGAKASDA